MSWLEKKRLLLCVGPGGVGKTTVAAAVALDEARTGRRVALLTIDPAKRLADALGLDGLSDELTRVELSSDARGELYAAMLDTQASYDSLMARLSGDTETTARILSNPVYRAFSRTLARSHAYIAMERLHAIMGSGEFDLVIVDTPPTRSALDILDAPDNLARFLDDDVVRWFLAPRARGPLAKLLPRGGRAVTRVLGMLASQRLVEQLAGFFQVLLDLRDGFRARAEETRRILREPSSAFVLVGAPTRTSLDDAVYLRDGLTQRDVTVDAIVCNRAFVACSTDATRPLAERGDRPRPESTEFASSQLGRLGYSPAERSPELVALLRELDRERRSVVRSNRAGAEAARELRSKLAGDCHIALLPELSGVVASLDSVDELSRAICWEFSPGSRLPYGI